jgi:hypothetical protein
MSTLAEAPSISMLDIRAHSVWSIEARQRFWRLWPPWHFRPLISMKMKSAEPRIFTLRCARENGDERGFALGLERILDGLSAALVPTRA